MSKNSGAAVYGIGFVGALVYSLQHAATLWEGVVGIVNAIIWPGLVVYKLFEFLNL